MARKDPAGVNYHHATSDVQPAADAGSTSLAIEGDSRSSFVSEPVAHSDADEQKQTNGPAKVVTVSAQNATESFEVPIRGRRAKKRKRREYSLSSG